MPEEPLKRTRRARAARHIKTFIKDLRGTAGATLVEPALQRAYRQARRHGHIDSIIELADSHHPQLAKWALALNYPGLARPAVWYTHRRIPAEKYDQVFSRAQALARRKLINPKNVTRAIRRGLGSQVFSHVLELSKARVLRESHVKDGLRWEYYKDVLGRIKEIERAGFLPAITERHVAIALERGYENLIYPNAPALAKTGVLTKDHIRREIRAGPTESSKIFTHLKPLIAAGLINDSHLTEIMSRPDGLPLVMSMAGLLVKEKLLKPECFNDVARKYPKNFSTHVPSLVHHKVLSKRHVDLMARSAPETVVRHADLLAEHGLLTQQHVDAVEGTGHYLIPDSALVKAGLLTKDEVDSLIKMGRIDDLLASPDKLQEKGAFTREHAQRIINYIVAKMPERHASILQAADNLIQAKMLTPDHVSAMITEGSGRLVMNMGRVLADAGLLTPWHVDALEKKKIPVPQPIRALIRQHYPEA